jgi:hypothetical protein
MTRDPRPPILYFRSFGDHKFSSTFTWMGPSPIGDLRLCGTPLTIGWAEFFGSPNFFEDPPDC